jgi:hypothetical protein
MVDPPDVPQIDVRLLAGFGFACRPDCGLCCYAEPRVLPTEKPALLQIVPEVEFLGRAPDEFLAAYPEGGSCRLLRENRCSAHGARPHPCREFPLTVHLGSRLQATVVLSCPGVDLGILGRYGEAAPLDSPTGFTAELAALRGRLDRSVSRRLDATLRRYRKVVRGLSSEGRWEEEEDVRRSLGRAPPLPTDGDFPATDPPSADDGLEILPLFFDRRAAPVALSEGLGGWELSELRPRGGVARSLGVIPPPERMPRLRRDAHAILRGYLRYWLGRDALFGAVQFEMLESRDGTVSEWVSEQLRAIGAITVSRAEARAKLSRGEVDELTAADLYDGIRATDQDLLDRPSWGDRF